MWTLTRPFNRIIIITLFHFHINTPFYPFSPDRKALKVADLKEILTKSSTPIPSKANKADLIAKILATPDALKLAGGDPAPVEATPAEAPAKPVDDDLVSLVIRLLEREGLILG